MRDVSEVTKKLLTYNHRIFSVLYEDLYANLCFSYYASAWSYQNTNLRISSDGDAACQANIQNDPFMVFALAPV